MLATPSPPTSRPPSEATVTDDAEFESEHGRRPSHEAEPDHGTDTDALLGLKRSSKPTGLPKMAGNLKSNLGADFGGAFAGSQADTFTVIDLDVGAEPLKQAESRYSSSNWKRNLCYASGLCLLVGAAVAGLALALKPGASCTFASLPSDSSSAGFPRNLILMIPDGFGPASQTLAREFLQTIEGALGPNSTVSLPLDSLLVGSCRTRSSSSLVTDSAAGATAYSTSHKTYNGGIAVDPDRKPLGTLFEAAKLAGYLTGLVVTSRITHATPAAFSSHVIYRDLENEIAEFQVGAWEGYPFQPADLLLGGGLCHFLPSTDLNSCRADGKDLLAHAAGKGFHVALNRSALAPKLPLLGLFTADHMPYEIDRPDSLPSLSELASFALPLLHSESQSAGNGKGFVALLEGSRIDMAGHNNDPAAHLRDILEFNRAVGIARKFADETPGTLLVVVADHETGGMALARQDGGFPKYEWKPEMLARVRNSTEALGLYLADYLGAKGTAGAATDEEKRTFVKDTVLATWLGITDPTDEELIALTTPGTPLSLTYAASDAIAKRALVGWSTHGHSGVDVSLYAHGAGSNEFRGNLENTEIGAKLARFLGVDVSDATKRLGDVTKGQVARLRRRDRSGLREHYHEDVGYPFAADMERGEL